jgi:hypothetical protein
VRDTPNFDDANFALRLYDLRRETELRKARNTVGDLDGAPWEKIKAVATWGHKENAHFRQATSYWEIAASFVNRGIFHPDVFLDTCGEGLYTYSVFKPYISQLRELNGPRFLVQLEKAVNDNPNLRERVAMIDKARADWTAKEEAEKAAKGKKKPAKTLVKSGK